jgi:hypothetical protein
MSFTFTVQVQDGDGNGLSGAEIRVRALANEVMSNVMTDFIERLLHVQYQEQNTTDIDGAAQFSVDLTSSDNDPIDELVDAEITIDYWDWSNNHYHQNYDYASIKEGYNLSYTIPLERLADEGEINDEPGGFRE